MTFIFSIYLLINTNKVINMSFNRLPYDSCSYTHSLQESMKSGEYILNTPMNGNNEPCFYDDPYLRMDKNGVSVCKDKALIDVDSELLGLNVKNSKCPTKKFQPSNEPFCNKTTLKKCEFLSREDTRLNNPPCTLRGTGWNRWEWLCENPQDSAIIPFETDVNYRMVVKENHRPCIPELSDDTLALPQEKNNIDKEAFGIKKNDWSTYIEENEPFVHWRCCGEIEKL